MFENRCNLSNAPFFCTTIGDHTSDDASFDIEASLPLLLNLPDSNDACWDEEDINWKITHVIARYVYKLYGKRNINTWAKKNMGCSILDLITPSDGAFTAVNIHSSNLEVWNQALDILRLDPEEQAKYKPKNRKHLPHDEE